MATAAWLQLPDLQESAALKEPRRAALTSAAGGASHSDDVWLDLLHSQQVPQQNTNISVFVWLSRSSKPWIFLIKLASLTECKIVLSFLRS